MRRDERNSLAAPSGRLEDTLIGAAAARQIKQNIGRDLLHTLSPESATAVANLQRNDANFSIVAEARDKVCKDLPRNASPGLGNLLDRAQIVVVCDCDEARQRVLAAFKDIPGFSIQPAAIRMAGFDEIGSVDASPEADRSGDVFSDHIGDLTLLVATRRANDAEFQGGPHLKTSHLSAIRDLSPVPDLVNRHGCSGGLAHGCLNRIKRYVDERLSAPISLVDLAKIAGLSVCHFGRAFKQSMGVTPHRYLMDRRLQEAARRLATGHDSISEIAFTTGFADQSHLTRAFVKLIGITPRNYRRQFR